MFIVSVPLAFPWKLFQIFWLMYRSAISLPTDSLPTYEAVYMHLHMYVCVCVCLYTTVYRDVDTNYLYDESTRTVRVEKGTRKKTWKCKYKQRSKTNTKKESTINNKNKITNRRTTVCTDPKRTVSVSRCTNELHIFLYYAQLWGVWGENRGGGGRRTTHLISLSNRVQHLQQQQQHLHNTQAPLQRF